MQKYFVKEGNHAGEMVVITGKEVEGIPFTIVQPIDDHDKDCGEEYVIPKEYLEEMW